MKKKFIKVIPSWQHLSSIGNNKVIKSTYIWIIVIPIIAKFLEKIPDNLIIPFYENIEIQLKLPFSWQLLYFSALIFAISTVMFTLFSPPLLSKFSDIPSYIEKGLGKEQLITFLSSWLRKNKTIYDSNGENINTNSYLYLFYEKYCVTLSPTDLENFKNNKISLSKRVRKLAIKDSEFHNSFWFLRSSMAYDGLILRILITILYLVGSSMLFKLLIDNIIAVIKMI